MTAPRIDPAAVTRLGRDLQRPEGVMVARDGAVWAADGRGGCTRVAADGSSETRLGTLGGEPNGICFDAAGRVIVANIGTGEVQRLDPATGRHEVLVTTVDGRRMTTPNFPFVDTRDRLWVSNSTARPHYMDAIVEPLDDGCLFVVERGVARIVAAGLWFANGVALDADESHVYVAESLRTRVTRFPIRADGTLGPREQYGPDLGSAPDGIAFDEAGNLWVTLVGDNTLGVIGPDGGLSIVLTDPSLGMPTNICFGGPDRRTAYVGSLMGTSLATFRVPHPGMALVHQR